MKSLARKDGTRADAYHQYLDSPAWRARRAQWISDHGDELGHVRCTVCLVRLTARTVNLHHLDYTGVQQASSGWVAGEADDELVSMCRPHHEALHVLFDRDKAWKRLGRKGASLEAIGKLRRHLARQLLAARIRQGHTR